MSPEPNWTELLKGWDRQQEAHIADREQKFKIILDVLEAKLPPRFKALDLGCGPGSLSARALERFPTAQVVAVDYDPVVLKVGQMALKKFGKRVTWLEADLGAVRLAEQLRPFCPFDAAISTTALHWLYPNQLRSLYRNLTRVIRRGGIFLNGDGMPWESNRRAMRNLSEKLKLVRSGKTHHARHAWQSWWKNLQRDPYFEELFQIRKTRFPEFHSHAKTPSLEFHTKTLKAAGFREVDTIWQDGEERVLVAFR